MNLFFYDVDVDYVKYLKQAEKDKRGFTRVPDIEYQNETFLKRSLVVQSFSVANGFSAIL
jgi:protein AbiQ